MEKNERLKVARIKSGKSQDEIAAKLGVSQAYIAGLENSTPFSFKKAQQLAALLNVTAEQLYFGDNGNITKPEKNGTHNKLKSNFYDNKSRGFESNAMLIGDAPDPWETEEIPLGNNKYGLTMPLVPVKAYAGLLDNYGDPEFYETLDKHTIPTAGNQHGSYLAFVVKGDSMENWSSEEMAKLSIPENWIVTARNLPRQHWTNKLHLHRWEMYVFVHKEGIIIKQVTEHNTAEGWVIAHSLNPDFKDRKIYFKDCYQVLNVVHKGVAL